MLLQVEFEHQHYKGAVLIPPPVLLHHRMQCRQATVDLLAWHSARASNIGTTEALSEQPLHALVAASCVHNLLRLLSPLEVRMPSKRNQNILSMALGEKLSSFLSKRFF